VTDERLVIRQSQLKYMTFNPNLLERILKIAGTTQQVHSNYSTWAAPNHGARRQ